MKLMALMIGAMLLGLAVPATADGHCTDADATDVAGVAWIRTDANGDPWIYLETNGAPGLQPGGEHVLGLYTEDGFGDCDGEKDTLVF